jgi:tetratricopeptide (TPR) repeat protein
MPLISPPNAISSSVVKSRIAVFMTMACLTLSVGCARQRLPHQAKLVHEDTIATGDLAKSRDVTLTFAESGYRFIEIGQEAADVTLAISTGSKTLGTWDAPARRAAPERACVYTDAGPLVLTLSSKDASSAANAGVSLHVLSLAGGPSLLVQKQVGAECLQSEAGMVLPEASETIRAEEVQRQAGLRAERYRQAGNMWTELGRTDRAAEAFLQAGWMFARRTSRYSDSIIAGNAAAEDYALTHDAVGKALAIVQLAVPRWELSDEERAALYPLMKERSALLALTAQELEKAAATFDAAQRTYYSAEARSHLGNNYFQQGLYEEAMQTFGAAKDLYRAANDPAGEIRAQANINIVLNQASDYQNASAAFDRLLTAEADDAATPELADILYNSATTHSAAGDYGKALPQFVRSFQIHERSGDLTGMARSLNGLAATYMRLGVPAAALGYAMQSGLLLRKRAGDAGPRGEDVDLTSELLAGAAQRALGQIVAASASHRTALKLARNDAARLRAHLELARDALAANDPAVAKSEIGLARNVARTSTAISPLLLDLEWARAEIAAGDDNAAYEHLCALRGRFSALGAREYEIELLDALARTQFARDRLHDALRFNASGLDVLHSLRLGVSNPELRARLTASYREAYELRVELLDAMRARAWSARRKNDLLLLMFAASDQARAGLVHENAEARALTAAAASHSPLREIAAEIALRERMLAAIDSGSTPSVDPARIQNELAILRAKYDTQAPASHERNSFYSTGYSHSALRVDTAVLVFLDSSRLLRRFLITKSAINELPDLAWSPEDRARNATRLLPKSDLLARYPHLVIVANSLVASLPFAALAADDGGNHPLATSHDITMSLTLRDALRIAALPDSSRRANLARVALFSDPVFTPYDERVAQHDKSQTAFPVLARLRHTRSEADAIATRVSHMSSDRSDLAVDRVLNYSGFDASRENALSPAAASATVLHFATHAVASDEWPNGSGLQLSGFTRQGKPLNGFLSTLDLLSQRTSTDLVVLSACDTARGEGAPGENVAGLARAFLGGGARRVVASLWKVDDAVTASLMSDFYAGLIAGETPAIALNAAQRKLAGPTRAGQRPFWAAFVLYERAPDR